MIFATGENLFVHFFCIKQHSQKIDVLMNTWQTNM